MTIMDIQYGWVHRCQIYCKMFNYVARDKQALIKHISAEHGLGLYVIELQKIISKLTGIP